MLLVAKKVRQFLINHLFEANRSNLNLSWSCLVYDFAKCLSKSESILLFLFLMLVELCQVWLIDEKFPKQGSVEQWLQDGIYVASIANVFNAYHAIWNVWFVALGTFEQNFDSMLSITFY